MKKNQKGFSAVELVLVVFVVTILALIGWFVLSVKPQKTKVAPSSTASNSTPAKTTPKTATFEDLPTGSVGTLRSFTDKAGVATVQYPSSWTYSDDVPTSDGGVGKAADTLATNFVSPNSPLLNSHTTEKNGVIVEAYTSVGGSQQAIKGWLGTQPNGKPYTPESFQVNGNQAYYYKDVFKVDSSEVTQHVVLVLHGTNAVTVFFQEKSVVGSTGQDATFDDTADLPGFKAIVSSVLFN